MPEAVSIFVGMTKNSFLMDELGVNEIFREYYNDKTVAFRPEQIFLHPKLQTKQVLFQGEKCQTDLQFLLQHFISTPDIALIKLERKVKFSSFVTPICLNRRENEKPICPDQSRDRRRHNITDQQLLIDLSFCSCCGKRRETKL